MSKERPSKSKKPDAPSPAPVALTREDALVLFRLGPDAVADTLVGMGVQIADLSKRVAELEGMKAKN